VKTGLPWNDDLCSNGPRSNRKRQKRLAVHDKIGVGRVSLNWLAKFSKLIAIASAVFLLSATLDNVPDCPELLNTASKSFVSGHMPHGQLNGSTPTLLAVSGIGLLPALRAFLSLSITSAPLRVRRTQSLYRVTDLPPPHA
jgi:hypothetical protein